MKRLIATFSVCLLLLSYCPLGTLPVAAATSGTTGDCTWSLDGTVLTISGTGEMENFYYNESSPWGKSVTKVVISDGVTSIGDDAFRGCDSLAAVTIPNSVTSIGEGAFFRCSNLRSITIPDSITNIGKYAFQNCYTLNAVHITDFASWCEMDFPDPTSNPLYEAGNLYCNGKLITDLKIPNGVKKIGAFTFTGCNGITSVTIPNSVTSIGSGAFWNCYGPTSITIPNSVTSIGDHAFSGCTRLTSITIPDGVISIENNVFSGCSKLTSVTIPNSVTSINSYAFKGCQSLTSIRIPYGVEHIGDCAFSDCNNLKSIAIPDSVRSIGEKAFSGCSIDQFFCIENSDAHLYAADQGFSCLFLPPVSAPTIESAIGNVIILTPIEGYEYSLDNVAWQDNSRFENLQPLIQYTFYQRIKAVDSYVAGYAGSGMVMAKPFAVAPTAPSIMEVTDNLVTLVPTVGYQYSKDGIKWQDSPQFDGLSPNTQYRFYARKAECEDAYASVASTACVTTTKKHIYTGAVSQPKLALAMATTVQLVAVDGYEYSLDGIVWQDSPTFSGLRPETSYTFYQRVTTTNTTYASEKSESLTVTTLKGYVISYNVGDGNNAPQKQIKTHGVSLTLTMDTPSRSGYRFLGWSLSLMRDVEYRSGDAFTIDEDSILYAQWVKRCTPCKGEGKIWSSRTCSSCGGTGYGKISCGRCNGKGTVMESCTCYNGKIPVGNTLKTCSACHGTGNLSNRCPSCGGSGSNTDSTGVVPCNGCGGNGIIYSTPRTCEACNGVGTVKEPVDPPLTPPVIVQLLPMQLQIQVVDSCEYSCDGKNWQDSPSFESLRPNTTYTIYQRFKETKTHYASQSASITITTPKLDGQTIVDPIVTEITSTSVTLKMVDGAEYSLGGIEWQDSCSFVGLSPNKSYVFYQRYKQTDITSAGKTSKALTIKTIETKMLAEILLQTLPKKTVYVESTSLDDAGMVLKLVYSNGTTEMITTGWISEYDFSVMGTRQVKVNYGGKTCTYSVTVVKKSLTSIAIQTSPNKLVYLEGDSFDTTGLTLLAYYDNGTHDIITSNWVVTGYNSTPGAKTITVTYGGKTTTFTVTVNAKTLTSIAVTKKPTKLMYTEGEAFNKSGLVVTAYYNNGTNAAVTEYTVSGYSSTSGTKTITVSYGGKTANFTVTVNKKPVTNGWVLEHTKWAFYVGGMKVTSQWQKDSKGWCYLGADGYMLTNEWVRDSVGWCYVGSDGYCVTNAWKKDSVGWCYLDGNGRMATNQWIKDSVGWCYVGSDGYCVTNEWKKDSVGWCYLDGNGRMATNAWVRDSIGWCYVGADGYAVTNCWKKDSVGWCYLNSNGSMTKSAWVQDGGKWYYLDANGYMVANKTVTISGKKYTFNASGVWIA